MLFAEIPPVTTPDPAPSPDVLLALNRAATTAKLMSGAAHEVNNALHVISGTVELLAERQGLPSEVGSALERIQRQTVIAAEALASVLVFTRAPLDAADSVDMTEMVTHSVALRKFAVRRAGLLIQLETDRTTTAIVRGNRGQLQQIVLNLIINAEQALAGAAGTITVSLTSTPLSVVLRVADAGPGVQDDTMLFRPFVTGPGRHDGAGLGLWAARALAEAGGGTVVLEPAQPGTVAVLTLPRAR